MNRYRLRRIGRFVACVYGAVFIWALATTILLGYQEGYHEEASKQRGEKQEISRKEDQHRSRQATTGDTGANGRTGPGEQTKDLLPTKLGSGTIQPQRNTNPASGQETAANKDAALAKGQHSRSHISRGGTLDYYTSEVTGYTKKDKGMNGKGITKTETKAKAGRTCAADFDIFPPGTVLDIEGIGVRVVEDVGGAIDNYDIDVFVDTKAEAYKIGRRDRKVRVISWGVR